MINRDIGLFIAFEGLDGSGKTTQVGLLEKKLSEIGFKTYVTCEPTESVIGTIIRQHMKHEIQLNEETIAGLFVADRLNHLLNKVDGICKLIKDGVTVITDRYYFSSYAYHSIHVPMKWVIEANLLCSQFLKPDINLYLDVTPENCLNRIKAGRKNHQRYENLKQLERVRENYFKSFRVLRDKENIKIIDATKAPGEVENEIWNCINNRFLAKQLPT